MAHTRLGGGLKDDLMLNGDGESKLSIFLPRSSTEHVSISVRRAGGHSIAAEVKLEELIEYLHPWVEQKSKESP